MDTAYQKWEKRRQERSGGQRRMARRRGSGAGVALGLRERRRLAQLAVCLALFLAVFVGKGIFPERLAEARETVLGVIQSDTDFQAAFSQLGWPKVSSSPARSKQGPRGPARSIRPTVLPKPAMEGGEANCTVCRPRFFVFKKTAPFRRARVGCNRRPSQSPCRWHAICP